MIINGTPEAIYHYLVITKVIPEIEPFERTERYIQRVKNGWKNAELTERLKLKARDASA